MRISDWDLSFLKGVVFVCLLLKLNFDVADQTKVVESQKCVNLINCDLSCFGYCPAETVCYISH